MRTSEQIDQLLTAVLTAKGSFGKIKKSKENPHFHFKYAPLEGIMGAIEPALTACDLMIVGGMHEAQDQIMIETRLYHLPSGQWMSSSVGLPMPPNPQDFGKAVTYVRRYNISALLNLQADDDLDAQVPRAAKAREAPPKAKTPAAPSTPRAQGPVDGDAVIPAELPCAGMKLSALKPFQVEMIRRKAEVLAQRDAGRWGPWTRVQVHQNGGAEAGQETTQTTPEMTMAENEYSNNPHDAGLQETPAMAIAEDNSLEGPVGRGQDLTKRAGGSQVGDLIAWVARHELEPLYQELLKTYQRPLSRADLADLRQRLETTLNDKESRKEVGMAD